MERFVTVVDPLPRLSVGVKTTLESIDYPDFTIRFSGKAESLKSLLSSLRADLLMGKNVGLILPYNTTDDVPVLTSYRQESGNTRLTTFDLLEHILLETRSMKADSRVPVVFPFLFLEKPATILQELNGRPGITRTLACLTKHIIGIDPTYSQNQIKKAFGRHLAQPEQDNYLMMDFIPKFFPDSNRTDAS